MTAPLQLRDSDWLELQRVLRQTLPQSQVWAFGSRTRGQCKPYSDLDIAIVNALPLSLAEMAVITDAFEQSDLSIRVDVVDWAAISPAFQALILQDKIVLQRPQNMREQLHNQ